MRISLVVAAAANGVIGRDGDLPWRLPGDLKRFKELTLGKPVLMGRRTWESLPRRPLPGRENLVVSRSAAPGERDGARWFSGIAGAIDHARAGGADELCVIGGAEIFRETLPLADTLHLTRVERAVEGDTLMPPPGPGWVERESGPLLEENGLPYRFIEYRRGG
ncbi:dihydrofolate reductase [Azospirillum thermophilum]|uniref:Dihydrofolate reductase n=1 Tax=Azospirillum thermophilum TaxID=2202148 RepID=A0A2S2CNT6_9PROT|nr:dihydrofolate reductase [Azospirillum thermophilum]AWK86095.1 dihydrofolate reductase [Azospirillum thermophilum]